jgi:nucleoside-diphosphate-sugar epimerase
MKVLVTGADGFVGRWLIRRLLDDGREVYGAVRPAEPQREDGLTAEERLRVRWLPLELTDSESVRQAVELPYDAVVHLAAISAGPVAMRNPGLAWDINASGTARLLHSLAEARRKDRADPGAGHIDR